MIGNETFRGNPVDLKMSRSKYHLCPTTSGTFNVGQLVPFYQNSLIMPGTTVRCSLRSLVRMATPIGVPMDNLYLDVFFFFVPHKLTLSRASMSPSVNDSNRSWAAFIGAQDSLLNMPVPSDVTLPRMYVGYTYRNNVGGYWDWTGNVLGSGSSGSFLGVNPLNFLAYTKIWNDYFRDPNGSMNPVTFSITSGYVIPSGGPSGWVSNSDFANNINMYSLLPACRFHGYFGSALPWPQRNSAMVTIPLGDKAPLTYGDSYNVIPAGLFDAGKVGLAGASSSTDTGNTGTQIWANGSFPLSSSLYADLSSVSGIAVEALRRYLMEQRWYESLARCGNNTLAEVTAGMFGVTPSDAVSNRAEYLGSKRIPLNIIQVNSTAGGYASTEKQVSLGSTGSFSLTNDDSYMFSKSFDTWGSLIGLAVVRADDTFCQGLEPQYQKFNRWDYYWPAFAHLGECPVLSKTIYADGSSGDETVFGYQEAWSEYRMAQNHVCGLLRPDQSLGYWTFANNFSARPTLNSFLDATGQLENIDRTLQVTSEASGFQFLGQFATDMIVVQPMPTYSIPGMADHY